MSDATTEPAPELDGFEWAVVEIFGHRRHAGRAREEERFGAKMLRIDIPTLAGPPVDSTPVLINEITAWTTHYYGGSSIFSYTLTDEAAVMRINRPYAPASRYIAPPDREDEDRELSESYFEEDENV